MKTISATSEGVKRDWYVVDAAGKTLGRLCTELAHRLRAMKGHDLEEGVSTRLLVYCACLIDSGMPAREAVLAALIEPLTDEPDVRAALREVAQAVIA